MAAVRHGASAATTRGIAEANRAMIVDALRRGGPMTRKHLVEATGLSTATVNRLIDDLKRRSLLVDLEPMDSTGGRPPRVVAFNGRAESVLAIDMAATKTMAALIDLDGTIVHQDTRQTLPDDDTGSGKAFDRLIAFVHDVVAHGGELGVPVRGVAVSVPGQVREEDHLVFAPALQWWSMPLGQLLEEQLALPVFVESDANLFALAEHRRGAGAGVQNMVALAIGVGVRAGLVLGGALYRGWQGGSGQVGHLLMERASLDRPWPNFGDLESRIGRDALIARAREAGCPSDVLPTDIFAAARRGEPAATSVIDELAEEVAMAVANIAAVVSPELVVIGGGVGHLADVILPRMATRLVGRVPVVPRIALAQLDDPMLVGAAELAIDATAEMTAPHKR